MTEIARTFYLTTAISYPNGEPHIGHAYEAIATDALARFKRLDGYDVRFVTGVDEHGLKMYKTAKDQGISPTELADRNTPLFERMVEALGCSHDDFISTREDRHVRSAQAIWRRMVEAGDIYKDRYAGWYSVRDEAYYGEDETAVSEAGERIGPQGTPVEWTEEESYFFRLSAYQGRLLELFEKVPGFVGPQERRNEVVSFVKGGLRDLSISRTTFDWGIRVPDDEAHIMYVWVDALTNYITAVGYPDENDPLWRYWPADLHVIGKDITRFHAVYWPAFLMSAGVALPRRIFSHGFLFNDGQKMSKSIGNVVDPFGMIDVYGRDQLRYFLLRQVPFGQDGSYSHEAIVARINADLANDLGNLAQRCLSMIGKHCAASVPNQGELSDDDKALLAEAEALLEACRDAFDRQAIHQALTAIWKVVGEANRYFAAQEPWALRKTDPKRMESVLYTTAEVLRQVAILVQPVMPAAGAALLDLLGVGPDKRDFASLAATDRLQAGAALPPPQAIFPRFVEERPDAA